MYSSSLSGSPLRPCGPRGGGGAAGVVLGRETVEADLENPGLPRVPIEHVDGAACLLSGGKEDRPVAARAVVGAEGDVSAQDGASLAEEILEVLPAHAGRGAGGEVSSAPSRLWRTARTHISDEELGCVCRAGDGGRRGRVQRLRAG